jgi:hypothetical protein
MMLCDVGSDDIYAAHTGAKVGFRKTPNSKTISVSGIVSSDYSRVTGNTSITVW